MNRASLWIAASVLGAAASFIAGAAGIFGLGFLVLSLPLLLRRPRLLAASGYLTGAGAFWLLLLWRQFASGGSLDQPTPWVAVGVAALTIGAVLTAAEIARGTGHRASSNT